MHLTEMDLVRSALVNALFSGLSLNDVLSMAEFAEDAADFEDAVNMLAYTVPEEEMM